MEDKKKRKSTGLLLSILGVLSLVLITAGVTYAFFSYTKEGQTENVIKTGSITFAYDETEANGAGIKIEDALPMIDSDGKNQTGAGKVFHFTVTSTTPSTASINYVVTARKTASSTLASDQVKLWLDVTANSGENNVTEGQNGAVKLYSELPKVGTGTGASSNAIAQGITAPSGTEERVIYEGIVPASSKNPSYTKNFTLRMWLNGETGSNSIADYSPYEFVLKSVYTTAGTCDNDSTVTDQANCTGNWTPAVISTTALDAEALIRNGSFITSETYYNGTTDKSLYDRIAFVSTTKNSTNGDSRTIISREQAQAASNGSFDNLGNWSVTTTPQDYVATEQYYQVNGQEFTVTVNVYASGATVTNTSGTGN